MDKLQIFVFALIALAIIIAIYRFSNGQPITTRQRKTYGYYTSNSTRKNRRYGNVVNYDEQLDAVPASETF